MAIPSGIWGDRQKKWRKERVVAKERRCEEAATRPPTTAKVRVGVICNFIDKLSVGNTNEAK